MPWSHRLPDYVALEGRYGQNLVELATLLATHDSLNPLQIIDVGANIGDSTKQVLNCIDARALAVEADPYYLTYLHRNLGDSPNVQIAPVLLVTDGQVDKNWKPVRRGGTTHFISVDFRTALSGATDEGVQITVQGLRAQYPEFSNVRLIKSDTDGHEIELIPELAEVYGDTRPVLFFEYDPRLTAAVSHLDLDKVWSLLAKLGYQHVGFWSNTGAALLRVRCEAGSATARSLLLSSGDRRVDYLDVAAVHGDDVAGIAVLDVLFSEGR